MIKLFDGAMGTMLHQAGVSHETCPDYLNLSQPDVIQSIHRKYIAAGADIIESNTFGANGIKLADHGLSDKVLQINSEAVRIARQCCGKNTLVAGSMGPTGKLLSPLGELDFEKAYEAFLLQARGLLLGGADLILIETIIDIQEMRAALLAAKDAGAKQIFCQLTFGTDGRTVTGTDPATAAILLESMGASVIGANCSLGPEKLLPIAVALAGAVSCPISIQPNAGMPIYADGKTHFPMGPEEMAQWAEKLIQAGVSYLGGCCGTTPEHIMALRKTIDNSVSQPRASLPAIRPLQLTSRSRTITISPESPVCPIGERINPTGRKLLAEALRAGDLGIVKTDAIAQARAGAGVLDVNVGISGLDQVSMMKRIVGELSGLVALPLCIDTTDPAVLEAGLRAAPGRCLVNSITAEPERLEAFLPLAKKYGAAVLCLPIDSDGIPETAAERVAIVQRLVSAALSAGLRSQDLLLDPLVMTLAADPLAAKNTLLTIREYRRHFPYPISGGLSNISHGLPRREIINAAFATLAMEAGVTAPIVNPLEPLMNNALSGIDLIRANDPGAKNYISRVTSAQEPAKASLQTPAEENPISSIIRMIINGEKEPVAQAVRLAIQHGFSSQDIMNQGISEAMNEIGRDFGTGKCFLPQVLLSAATTRIAFDTLRVCFPTQTSTTLGTVVLATVKGDLHDLGKNIVAALLENSGFRVIDLGKDVSAETVVKAAKENSADIVGLCALMTTTLPALANTLAALREAGVKSKTIIGGAVVNAQFSEQVGAHAYAPDAIAAVSQAKSFCLRS